MNIAAMKKRADEAIGYGFNALKWDPFGPAYLQLPPQQLRKALEQIETVREHVGPDIDLLIEAHGRFDVPTVGTQTIETMRAAGATGGCRARYRSAGIASSNWMCSRWSIASRHQLPEIRMATEPAMPSSVNSVSTKVSPSRKVQTNVTT